MSDDIPFDVIACPIWTNENQAKKDYPIPELWATLNYYFPHTIGRMRAFSLIVGVCPHCLKERKPCNCEVDR